MINNNLRNGILNIFRILTVGVAVTLGISCFAYQNYLNGHYLEKAPKSPKFDTEEVVETNEHDTIFYLTGQNKTIYILLPFTGGVILILASVIYNVWKPSR